MSYYKNFDTIGLISLNDWYVIDFPLKNYDENGNEIESAASTSFLSGNTGEISYSSDERKEAISLCIVDFKTLDIYSLQDYWRSYFVRDYYVEMDFDDNIVRTEVFYLPERQ